MTSLVTSRVGLKTSKNQGHQKEAHIRLELVIYRLFVSLRRGAVCAGLLICSTISLALFYFGIVVRLISETSHITREETTRDGLDSTRNNNACLSPSDIR